MDRAVIYDKKFDLVASWLCYVLKVGCLGNCKIAFLISSLLEKYNFYCFFFLNINRLFYGICFFKAKSACSKVAVDVYSHVLVL